MNIQDKISHFFLQNRSLVPEEEQHKYKDILLKWEQYKEQPQNLSTLESNLSAEQVGFIHRLIELYPNIVFGGSIALVAAGLLDRKIKDVDAFVLSRFEGDCEAPGKLCLRLTEAFDEGTEDMVGSMTTTNVNGQEILRRGLSDGKVHGCLFFVDKGDLAHTTTTVFGKEIKIQNIQRAIAAKKSYAKFDTPSAEKHRKDLKQIAENLINF